MATGTLTIRVRPLRIAFLVDPAEHEALAKAIEINTALWGGAYNPIIPTFSRTPRKWEQHPVRVLPKPAELLKGYLDGFDPDLVVPLGSCAGRSYAVGHRDIASSEEVLGNIAELWAPRIGVGFLEVLQNLLSQEFKFQRLDGLTLMFPTLPNRNQLFYASLFGSLPPSLTARIPGVVHEAVPLVRPSITLDSYDEYLGGKYLFPRRISSHSLDTKWWHSPTLFILDAADGLDIIDYWNLRAAGHYVVPVPIQALRLDSAKRLARRFIEMNFRPYRDNPTSFHHTTVQKSRSLREALVREFVESLGIEKPKEANRSKFVYRFWYPRIWDQWARDNSWPDAIRLPYSHEIERSISEDETRLDLRSEDPRFELAREYSGQARFANEFAFQFYGSKEPMAEVIPEGGKSLSTAIGRVGYENWRFSRKGLVFLAHNPKDLVFVDLPRAEPVMVEWLRERGWTAELSAPGRMAAQLFRQLGGAWGISWLAHKGVIPLLGELENEAGLSWPALVGRLQQIISAEELLFGKERFLEGLIETNAVRLGASIQCPVCIRHNWFELDKLNYRMRCKFCLSDFEPPITSPKEIEWAYRAHGPYASSSAQGAFSVLLTLKFISARDTARVTPLFSYEATKAGQKGLESDLTCLYEATGPGDSQTYVVHAECKSFGGFEARDFERMEQLSKEFPGAALVFSTLLDRLDSYSTARLAKLAVRHRRNRITRRPYSPVIVLTSSELFSMAGAPRCWEHLPIYSEAQKPLPGEAPLNRLSDVTQRIHLGLTSWREWSENEMKRRGARSQRSLVTPAPPT